MELVYIVFGIILCVLCIIEAILYSTWNKIYFLYGIPSFSKKIEFSNLNSVTNGIIYFITNMENINDFSKYKGKIAAENIFFFRKKMITVGRNDFENIYGKIIIDTENRVVIIKGFMGYSFLAVMLYFFSYFADHTQSFLVSVIPILIIFLISFTFNHNRYKKMVKEISNLIS